MKRILLTVAAALLLLLTVTTLELPFGGRRGQQFLTAAWGGMRSTGKGVEKCGSANA